MQTRDPRGRKKTGKIIRTAKVQCSLTQEDAQWWNDFAIDCGFVSRSQMITTILERMQQSGCSPVCTMRLSAQILHRLEQRKKDGKTTRQTSFDFDSLLLRPLPALPEDAPTSETAEAEALAELNNKTQMI